jgi:hypothetical protein
MTPRTSDAFAFQGIPEGANPYQVICGYLTARLNFQRYQTAGLFQNEIYFVPRTSRQECSLRRCESRARHVSKK